jgi:hypothetical protein
MQATDLDPSLAFTALLELDPEFGKLAVEDGHKRQQQLLAAWYAQGDIRNLMDFTRAWLTWIPVGTRVRFRNRDFTVTGYGDVTLRKDLPAEAVREAYPAGEAYELWPVGVPHKFGERGGSWSCVRRQSLTPIAEEEVATS